MSINTELRYQTSCAAAAWLVSLMQSFLAHPRPHPRMEIQIHSAKSTQLPAMWAGPSKEG